MVKVLYNIKSVLNFSEDFDVLIKNWYQDEVKSETFDPITKSKERLNIEDVYWLLGKDNVDLKLERKYSSGNKEKLVHENIKETIRDIDEEKGFNDDGANRFEIPDKFLGMDLSIFKDKKFENLKPRDKKEKTNEFLLDLIYKNKNKRKNDININKQDKEEGPEYIKLPLNEKGPFMGGMFGGLAGFMKPNAEINSKEIKRKCNVNVKNFKDVKDKDDKDKNKITNTMKYEDKPTYQRRGSMFETSPEAINLWTEDLKRKERKAKDMTEEKVTSYLKEMKDDVEYVSVEEKSTGQMIVELLSQVKKLNLNLGSLSDLGLKGLKIPTLDDVLPESNKNNDDEKDNNYDEEEMDEENADTDKIEDDKTEEISTYRFEEDEEEEHKDREEL